MNKIIKSLLIPTTLATAVVPFVVAVSCAKENPFDQHSITLSSASENMVPGQNVQLKAYVNPPTLSQEVTWSSSNESIANVNSSGFVQANDIGIVNITATSIVDPTLSASCNIVVSDPRMDDYNITINSEDKSQGYTTSEQSIAFPFYVSGKDCRNGDTLSVQILDQKTVGWSEEPHDQHTIKLINEPFTVNVDGPTYIYFADADKSNNDFVYWKNEFTISVTPMRNGVPLSLPIQFNELFFISSCTSYPAMFTYEPSTDYGGWKITGMATNERWNYCSILSIPSTYMQQPVTEIDYGAFSYKLPSTVTRLVFDHSEEEGGASNIKEINASFKDCTSLTGPLQIPASVEILSGSFSGCSSLTSLEFKKDSSGVSHLKKMYASTFSGCSSLHGTIHFPPSVETIGNSCFADCNNLEGIEFSVDSNNRCKIDTISYGVFESCYSLKGIIKIPASIKIIDTEAFYWCKSIEGVEFLLDNNNETSLESIGIWAFGGCTSISGTLKIPASVQTIYKECFWHCLKITRIEFLVDNQSEMSLSHIYSGAFSGCGVTDTSGPDGGPGFICHGTTTQWKKVIRENYWHSSDATLIKCSDDTCGLDDK